MRRVEGDLWQAEFIAATLASYVYSLEGWIDPFRTWRRDLRRWSDAGQDISAELQIGARLIEDAARRSSGVDAERLRATAARLSSGGSSPQLTQLALDDELDALMSRYPDRRSASRYRDLILHVDPRLAEFGAWYEAFPRSFAAEAGAHGTFRDCETTLLPYVAEMGFDILYLPPIHPIGRTNRKGKNNALSAEPGDPGSPWGIGSVEGGHKSIHPELCTMKDFHRFVAKAKEYGIDIALDVAFQCSPDHPYVREHPEWFRRRPDGSIQYAENPPKRYEDIHPFDYDTADREALWDELKSIFTFWIEQGVHIFRVDNPHTKPFALWEWLLADVKRQCPETIFLAEAFTHRAQRLELSKRGFTQSYVDFAWKNTKQEITDYLTEFTQTERKEYFRPNAWPNTPDILSDYLRTGGSEARAVRFVLAATLCASYGIYGPSFELGEVAPRTEPGSDEYQHSEKYEIKHWEIDRPDSLRPLITRVNAIRRENPALHSNNSLRFHCVDNDQLICYSKETANADNVIIVVVNLDPHRAQSGSLDLPIEAWGLRKNQTYRVTDLLDDMTYTWKGPRNCVELDPAVAAAHIFRVGTHGAEVGQ
jgi:starch synthase (maltosyl-transferring)